MKSHPMNIKTRLTKAKDLISDPKNWGKGEDRNCLCALDALRVGEDETDEHPEVALATDYLLEALPPTFVIDKGQADHPVAQFNDSRYTRHRDIMALYNRAIDLA